MNRLDEPVLMAGPKPMWTEFGIHHRLESCEEIFMAAVSDFQVSQLPPDLGRGGPDEDAQAEPCEAHTRFQVPWLQEHLLFKASHCKPQVPCEISAQGSRPDPRHSSKGRQQHKWHQRPASTNSLYNRYRYSLLPKEQRDSPSAQTLIRLFNKPSPITLIRINLQF